VRIWSKWGRPVSPTPFFAHVWCRDERDRNVTHVWVVNLATKRCADRIRRLALAEPAGSSRSVDERCGTRYCETRLSGLRQSEWPGVDSAHHDAQIGDRFLLGWWSDPGGQCPSSPIPSTTDEICTLRKEDNRADTEERHFNPARRRLATLSRLSTFLKADHQFEGSWRSRHRQFGLLAPIHRCIARSSPRDVAAATTPTTPFLLGQATQAWRHGAAASVYQGRHYFDKSRAMRRIRTRSGYCRWPDNSQMESFTKSRTLWSTSGLLNYYEQGDG